MHSGSLDQLTYPHVFLGLEHDRNERRTWFVVGLTFSMMVAEIVGGVCSARSLSSLTAGI